MPVKRLTLFLVGFFFLNPHLSKSQTLQTGSWQGNIHYDAVEVPFRFDLAKDEKGKISATIINGDERIIINNIINRGDSLIIPLGVFDSELRIKISGNVMTGEWHKNYRKTKGPLFTARYNSNRFTSFPVSPAVAVGDRLKMTLMQPNGVSTNALGLFSQDNNYITGTILTEVGDYRYFEGLVNGDSLVVSSFDGVHAFLLTGSYNDGKWKGVLYYEPGYSEHWEGWQDNAFNLIDPFEVMTVEPGSVKPYYDILTAGGTYNAIDADSLQGKVVIIQLMGTWCPNSLDQTHFLTTWAKENQDKKIAIIAVDYEPGDKLYAEKRIDSYKKMLKVPYSMFIGGSMSKGQAALAFPNMERINAFPTLVIIDKKGFIRYMSSYFNGPATGVFYNEFVKKKKKKIDALLAE